MTAIEVLLDCPHCRVESAVVAILDPDPIEQRCRVCGWSPEGDGAPLTDPTLALAALTAFAEAEGESDVDAFCAQSVGIPADEFVRRLVAKEPIPTNFDAVAWLFGSGGRAGVSDASVGQASDRTPPPLPVPVTAPPGPRFAARALASVMVADGEVRPRERQFVDRWLASRGLPAVAGSELRVWRPHELGPVPPALRDELLLGCIELAHVDQQPDDAEWRVVQAYGRAWGASDAWLAERAREADARHATALVHVWRRMTSLVRTR